MDDPYDELLTKAGIAPGSGSGINDYCASRGWKAERTSDVDGRSCVTIWPADYSTVRCARLEDAVARACFVPDRTAADGAQRAIVQASRAALGQALEKFGLR